MANTLYLIHSASAPQRLAQALDTGAAPVPWLFLCQDYARLLRWEHALGTRCIRLPVRAQLAAAAAELRRPFLDLMAELGRKHDSLAWWGSRIAERNTAVSPLFLYCCYLRLARSELARSVGPLAITCESWALLDGLERHALQQGYSVRCLSKPGLMQGYFKPCALGYLRVATFVARALLQAMSGFAPAQLPADRPGVLLRTFLEEQCLGEDGEFRDRYLPGLCAWLERQGLAVAHLPVLANMQRGTIATWRWLARCRLRFIDPYRCYRIADYLAALREARRSRRLEFGSIALAGLDVGRLFEEAKAGGAYDSGTLEALLSHRLPLRLRERNINISLFIDEYENMVLEKPLIAGFRKYSPQAKLVGFQHGALYPMLLCNFVTREEAKFAPLPDRIVCNGPFFRDILIEEGLPADRVIAGPALRYRHLWRETPQAGARKGIFVPLPLMQSDAVELLTKLAQAFEGEHELTLSLKAHPMSSERNLSAAGIATLPRNFHLVTGDIGLWLARSQAVIALSSSALYEALAAGVPVVPVARETALDLNPLAWHARFERQFCSAAEIRDEALRLLRLSADELQTYRADSRQILAASFGEVNESTLRSFIDGLLPERATRLTK